MKTTINSDTNNTLAAIQLNQVIEQLNSLSTDELVNLYIEYASDNSYETIYNLDESTINELYNSPWQALYDSNHKDFDDRDYFFTYNGNGHMVSFSNKYDDKSPIDVSELAQWLISEDKLAEYDITVTTLDDMLASIEDNISDDKHLLSKLADYLGQSLHTEQVEQLKVDGDYYDYLVSRFMGELNDCSYNDLNDLINTYFINYSAN